MRRLFADAGGVRDEGVAAMPFKAIAFIIVVGLSVLLVAGLHKENRADAAGGNCYASAQGPSSPTLCQ